MATETDEELAERLFAEWDYGAGTSKSELERRTWGDGKSHGRKFDRFVREHLGVSTAKPSRQTNQIEDLEQQVKSLGQHPVGTKPTQWEVQLQHARSACLSALRVWNDPIADFRAGAFSLLLVSAWNSLALALLMRDGLEWRRLDKEGRPLLKNGAEQSLDTINLVRLAFNADTKRGLRKNVRFWVDLRNTVAHRHLPALDLRTIPFAQAALLNFEGVLVDEFGDMYQLGDRLSIPLQLAGFRNPDVLDVRRRALAALPIDVQSVLSRADEADADLLADETFLMRVAFVPVVPSSGNNPDAIAYFVRPGEVPDELNDTIQRYLVIPKAARGPRPSFGARQVVDEVKRRIPFRFNTNDHAAVARHLGVRPERGEPDRSLNELFCEYVTAAKIYVYNQQWIDRVVAEIENADGYRRVVGRNPVRK